MIKHGDDLGMVYDVGFPVLYTFCLDLFCHSHRDAPNFCLAFTQRILQKPQGRGHPSRWPSQALGAPCTWNRPKTWNRFNVVHRCSPQLDIFWLFWIKPMVFDMVKWVCFGTTNGFLTYFDIASFVDAPCAIAVVQNPTLVSHCAACCAYVVP